MLISQGYKELNSLQNTGQHSSNESSSEQKSDILICGYFISVNPISVYKAVLNLGANISSWGHFLFLLDSHESTDKNLLLPPANCCKSLEKDDVPNSIHYILSLTENN